MFLCLTSLRKVIVIGTMHTSYGFKRTSLETVETANNCLHDHIEKNGSPAEQNLDSSINVSYKKVMQGLGPITYCNIKSKPIRTGHIFDTPVCVYNRSIIQ